MLKRRRGNIASYDSSLRRKLEGIRSELDLHGADDIRMFTYVTAIFLPIGFATGVFSMSEAPSNMTLYSMIGTAAITLLLTFIALINANFLRKWVVKPVILACSSVFHAPLNAIHDNTTRSQGTKDSTPSSASSDQKSSLKGK